MINCMLAGVGGQGTVLASKLIATAAINSGMEVRTTETIGMAQRGGSVVSHVRMGQKVHSPLIPLGGADVIIGFELAETVRLLPYLAPQGCVIVCDTVIKPVTSGRAGTYPEQELRDCLHKQAASLVVISSGALLAQCPSPKTVNVAMLGAAVQSGRLPFDVQQLEEAVRQLVPERFWAMNLEAIQRGRELYHGTANTEPN